MRVYAIVQSWDLRHTDPGHYIDSVHTSLESARERFGHVVAGELEANGIDADDEWEVRNVDGLFNAWNEYSDQWIQVEILEKEMQ